ncbi:hypothetical protein [Paenibacillus rigui]|uniref:Fungal lipase-like domain-containing protein n=1 Tax=Paenibacillus rigui TaxID=554312 RepID=A0A229UQN3_9BACL|nr:hypothetical protein [Paenibacillus rigui]OXM85613.1 hypothetical protein CF651_14605 [Paenibacillus rigui]
MKRSNETIALFTLAGIATAPGFLDTIRDELSFLLRARGYTVEADSLYPYGDWSRRLVPQLYEIFRDLIDVHERFLNSIGVRATRERIFHAAAQSDHVLLVGHSGGGLTAVQLAGQMIKAGFAPPLVIQIGSPRCPIRRELQDRVLFLSAEGLETKRKDPVARLGHWRGWRRGPWKFPQWKRNANAPGTQVVIPLIGGHPDYFRSYAPYVDEEGDSNLHRTLQPLDSWLTDKLPEQQETP